MTDEELVNARKWRNLYDSMARALKDRCDTEQRIHQAVRDLQVLREDAANQDAKIKLWTAELFAAMVVPHTSPIPTPPARPCECEGKGKEVSRDIE